MFKVNAIFGRNTKNPDEEKHSVGKHLGIWNMDYVEVIGNIYETPKLLTK